MNNRVRLTDRGPFQNNSNEYRDNFDNIFKKGPQRTPLEPTKETDVNSTIGRIEKVYRKEKIRTMQNHFSSFIS